MKFAIKCGNLFNLEMKFGNRVNFTLDFFLFLEIKINDLLSF